jgi:hypothetical protein
MQEQVFIACIPAQHLLVRMDYRNKSDNDTAYV